MANANSPHGLRPVRHRDGRPYNGAANRYWVPSGDSSALFLGDPVINKTDATGGGSDPVFGYQRATIGSTAVGNYLIGAVIGTVPATRDSTVYRAASENRVTVGSTTGCFVLVADDPDILFEVMLDSTWSSTYVGLNMQVYPLASGSTATGWSGYAGSVSSIASTSTLHMRIVAVQPRDTDNSINPTSSSSYCRVLAAINLHQHRNVAGG